MSKDFFKVKKGLNIQPTDPSTLEALEDGDIIIDSTDDNRMKVYDSAGGDFASVGTGGSSGNFLADFEKLTPDLSNVTSVVDTVTFLPIDDNNKSVKATWAASAGYIQYESAVPADVEGQGLMTVWLKTSVEGLTLSTTTDGVVQSSVSVIANNKWKQYEIPYVIEGTEQGFRVEASGSVTGDVFIDEAFVGLAPSGYIQQVGQAHFVGSATEAGNAGCIHTIVNTATQTFESMGTNTNCTSYTNTGSVVGYDDQLKIKILNARTDGTYKITLNSLFVSQTNTGASVRCYFDLFNDSTKFNNTIFTVSNSLINGDDTYANYLSGSIKFNTSGDKDIEVKTASDDTTYSCRVANDTSSGTRTKKWMVEFFPDDNSTIVSQNNELVRVEAYGNGSGAYTSGNPLPFTTIRKDNFNAWNGVNTFTSPYNTCYAFNGNIQFDALVSGAVSVISSNPSYNGMKVGDADSRSNPNFQGRICLSTGQTFSVSFNASANNVSSMSGYYINIMEEAGHRNVVGKFDQINSSELVFDELIDNTGQNVNNNVDADIDGITYTVTKASKYFIDATSTLQTNATGFFNISVKKNTSIVSNYFVCNKENLNWISCRNTYIGNFEVGDTIKITVRQGTGATQPVNLSKLTIQELPDTESIIKNLSQEKTKCQTKYLSGDVTANGTSDNTQPDYIATLDSIEFNNLTVGKRYSVNSYAVMGVNSDSSIVLEINNGSENIVRNIAGNSNGVSNITGSSVGNFIATNSTLSAKTVGWNNTSQILYGNGTRLETNVTLCQLPDTYVDTDEW